MSRVDRLIEALTELTTERHLMDWISEELGLTTETQTKIIGTLIVLGVAIVVRIVVARTIQRNLDDTGAMYRTGKLVTYVTSLFALIGLAWVWIDAFDNLGTYLAVVSAGLAIALADVLKNIAGWAYIVLRRPFRVGDRIEINGTRGDVLDVRLFRFTVAEIGNWVDADQSTGRLIHVPNGVLFASQVANYTEGFEFVWHEVPVLITFESDWRLAEQRLVAIVHSQAPDIEARAGARIRETARSYHMKLDVLRPAVYLTVKDSGVLLTARFLAEPRSRRLIEEKIWRSVLEMIETEPAIELAYPTIRGFLRDPLPMASGSDT